MVEYHSGYLSLRLIYDYMGALIFPVFSLLNQWFNGLKNGLDKRLKKAPNFVGFPEKYPISFVNIFAKGMVECNTDFPG